MAFVEGSSLVRRTAILFGGIAVLALLLTPTTGTAASRRATALAAQQQPADSPALEARGRELYQNACASCHGPDPAGPLLSFQGIRPVRSTQSTAAAPPVSLSDGTAG